ncbi:MAG: TA system VapC family ribonuclease toxin [Lacisediminihabitans sp.]
MILDVNVLLYAIDTRAPQHEACRSWLENALNGTARVGFPWSTILGFLRIATHPRVMTNPLSTEQAWAHVDDWLDTPVAWVPLPTLQHLAVLRRLTTAHTLSGNLIPDAHLAALALEHGVPVVSCDTDFARFSEVTWINPVLPRRS